MMVWLWGVNLWIFAQSSVNYAKIFDLDQSHLTQREIWKVVTFLMNWLSSYAFINMLVFRLFVDTFASILFLLTKSLYLLVMTRHLISLVLLDNDVWAENCLIFLRADKDVVRNNKGEDFLFNKLLDFIGIAVIHDYRFLVDGGMKFWLIRAVAWKQPLFSILYGVIWKEWKNFKVYELLFSTLKDYLLYHLILLPLDFFVWGVKGEGGVVVCSTSWKRNGLLCVVVWSYLGGWGWQHASFPS